MTVRITFRSELFIEGENLEEIVNKFHHMTLYSEEALKEGNAGYVELVSFDDEDTGEDLMREYNLL